MSKTIIGDFFTIRDEDLEETTEYLSQLGMTFNGGIEKCLFSIQLRELPEILCKLEQSGYFDFQGGAKEWQILKISSDGVALYIASPVGDGYIFLPKSNIISIHTIGKKYLDELKELKA